jgi:pimeloyl-ACP methyl ester carboxylesterase/DNA-binding CsgD family transcriptional regulator
MTSLAHEPADSAETELIKLVYTLVVEPERLHLMLQLLDEAVSPVFELDTEQAGAPFFEHLQVHFDNAFDMLHRREENEPNRSIARKLVDIDPQPSLLIDGAGKILRSNMAASDRLKAVEGHFLNVALFSQEDSAKFQRDLKAVNDSSGNRFIGVYEFSEPDADKPWKMVLSKAIDTDGQFVGHLASLKTRWQSHIGQGFSEAFKLTPVEQVIVQAVVEGQSLNNVAKARGRSLGTVRNQMKRLLAKLGLKSQTELICLYAGFAQIAVIPSGLNTPIVPPVREDSLTHIFTRRNGTPLEVEFFGAANGKPVLFFHPFMGGTLLSEQQKAHITARNLRFIMPLLPGYKGTTDADPLPDRVSRYAEDLRSVLDDLHISRCPAVGVNTSYLYALALAEAAPGTLTQIVVGNAAVPLKTSRQFRQVSIQQRIPYLVSRHVPALLKFYVRSVQAKLDAGYDEEYITRYYEESPMDQVTVLSPEIRSLARLSIVRAFQNGHETPVQHLLTEVSDWDRYLDAVTLPICLLNGDQDTEYSHTMVAQSVAGYPNITCEQIVDAGALLWYQKPDEVLKRIVHQADPPSRAGARK